MDSTAICSNCGTSLKGEYCYQCGQKVLTDSERSVKHFFFQFLGAAFFLENKFIKNIWYLLVRPGFLPSEIIAGRRKRYMPPFSLFFLVNLIYFIFVVLSDLNLSLSEQVHQPHHAFLVKEMVERKVEERKISFSDYEEEYNRKSSDLSKSLIVLHVPMIAFFLMMLYWKKNLYYLDHLIFSLYTVAFILLSSLILFWVFVGLSKLQMLSTEGMFQWHSLVLLVYFLIYFPVSLHRFYKQNWIWTSLKTVGLILAIIISHFVYRTFLFFITFYVS